MKGVNKMMYGMDGGGYMWFGMIFWLIFLGVIVWAVIMLVNRTSSRNQISSTFEAPLDILKKRYAKGVITKSEFEQMRNDLKT